VKVHLIGICGTGMGSFAGLLKAAGHDVRGSDDHVYPPMSTQLADLNIPVFQGFGPQNLEWAPERVVVGNVCRKDHVEVVAAQEKGLPLTSFPALLSELFLAGHHSCVVAGTHGKTTSSALLAHVLTVAGQDPSFLVGGVPRNFGRGWRLGGGPHFVVEGDEYDTAFFDKGSKFFHYQPRTALLTSVELDHVDIFADLTAVEAAFARFVGLIPPDGTLVVAQSSPRAMALTSSLPCRVESYGRPGTEGARWRISESHPAPGGRTVFDVTHDGAPFGRFEIGLGGAYNLENALGVIAVAHAIGVDKEQIARGLFSFLGVKRRQEVRGVAQGVTVVDDFAHHPTAVRETLLGLRGRHGKGRLFAVFEPRSATSRRAVFQQDFADAFSVADEVVVAPLYDPHKIPEAQRFDPERMAADLRGRNVPARLIDGVDAIVQQVAERSKPGDTVVVMSSGSFGGIHDKLLARLGDAVVPAGPDDVTKVSALLSRAGLHHPGLVEHIADFLLIRDASTEVVGCVALELHGETALLRSLAVSPERRGEGLGWMLADALISQARARGVRRIYLLTESAGDFFAQKLGFVAVPRESVDAAVRASGEFSLAQSARFACMMLDLRARAE
jgi:UDP-N-acetylmuramate: L-alanyl-gamma-D-glutamyl-meso-diaminopimelate ligase